MVNVKKSVFGVGFFILIFIAAVIGVSTALFILGITVSWLNVPLAYLATLVFYRLFSDRDKLETFHVVLVGTMLILICILFSTCIFDQSYDGNTYHKTCIGMMKNGWNPVYSSFEEFAERSQLIPTINWSIWYDHYAKGTWVFSAAVYAFTGNIESGKCFTLLAIISVFCILHTYLGEIGKFKRLQMLIIVFLAVFNPITIPQLQSYYADGFLWLMLLLCVATLIHLSFNVRLPDMRKRLFAILFICIAIVGNIKFSGFLYAGIYCFGFYVFWLVRARKEKEPAHFKEVFKKLSLFYLAAVLFTGAFFGSTSYLRNLIQHHNPFYSLVGADKADIITTTFPMSFEGKSNIWQFIHSLFSQTSNLSYQVIDQPQLKLPFSVTKDELMFGSFFDARISAWGVLFSGILLVSIVMCILLLPKLRKQYKTWFTISLLVLGLTVIQPFFIPALAMARYFPHLFLIPLFALGLIFWQVNKTKRPIIAKITSATLTVLMFANLLNYAVYSVKRINDSQDMRADLINLRLLSQQRELEITLPGGESFQGILFNLDDAGIKNYKVNPELNEYIPTFGWKVGYRAD